MKKVWYDEAWEQFCEMIQLNARMARRINLLLTSIDRNGYSCIGNPEALRGDLTGWWSVRIDKQNRLVFQIANDEIVIHSCAGHYE